MNEKDGRHVIDAIWTGARTLYETELKIPGTEQPWTELSAETQGVYFSLAMATINAYEVDLWHPIETAPRDGSDILCLWGPTIRLARYLDNSQSIKPWQGWIPVDRRPFDGRPTQWRPLPTLPENADA